MSETEWAWAAGFIDGEGCFTNKRKDDRPILKVTQVRPEPLRRLHELMGGSLSGPRNPPSHRGQPFYLYTLSVRGLRKAIPHLWPYLSLPKREQYERVASKPPDAI